MLRYQVRSREIVDLITALRSGRLVLNPYFQRNFVWRDVHKREFIDTILKGYPFPQIFLARGDINVDNLQSSTCVVDGQQRLTTIRDYIDDEFSVDGHFFSELDVDERARLLKYEVAVIDFDLEPRDPRLIEIFHRLNRTYYSVSAIEKISTEFGPSELMVVAKMLNGEFRDNDVEIGDEENAFLATPNIPAESMAWASEQELGSYEQIMNGDFVFSNQEIKRQVPLMFTLNLICTYLEGYYNRNTRVKELLERHQNNFAEKDEFVRRVNLASDGVLSMNLPNTSMWWNKANLYSLLTEALTVERVDWAALAPRLIQFEAEVPPEYALAAREAVNNRNQRVLRGNAVRRLLLE
tara:strand:- start:268 stop:1326 length:1059 start_codon:yes stop_codon:yes gene_type:complete